MRAVLGGGPVELHEVLLLQHDCLAAVLRLRYALLYATRIYGVTLRACHKVHAFWLTLPNLNRFKQVNTFTPGLNLSTCATTLDFNKSLHFTISVLCTCILGISMVCGKGSTTDELTKSEAKYLLPQCKQTDSTSTDITNQAVIQE